MIKPSLCASCCIVNNLFLSFNRTYLVGEGQGRRGYLGVCTGAYFYNGHKYVR